MSRPLLVIRCPPQFELCITWLMPLAAQVDAHGLHPSRRRCWRAGSAAAGHHHQPALRPMVIVRPSRQAPTGIDRDGPPSPSSVRDPPALTDMAATFSVAAPHLRPSSIGLHQPERADELGAGALARRHRARPTSAPTRRRRCWWRCPSRCAPTPRGPSPAGATRRCGARRWLVALEEAAAHLCRGASRRRRATQPPTTRCGPLRVEAQIASTVIERFRGDRPLAVAPQRAVPEPTVTVPLRFTCQLAWSTRR